MNKNQIENRNLISRFSNSLLGRGKKVGGHKLLFNSLFALRCNTKKQLLSLGSFSTSGEHQAPCDASRTDLEKKMFVRLVYCEAKHGAGRNNNQFSACATEGSRFLRSNGKRRVATLNASDILKNSNVVTFLASSGAKSLAGYSTRNHHFANSIEGKDAPSLLKNLLEKLINKKKPYVRLSSLSLRGEPTKVCKVPRLSGTIQDSDSQYKSTSSLNLVQNKTFCQKVVTNVKPILEIRKVRKGRITYRIPLVTRVERQQGKAISWLIESACSRKKKLKSFSKPSIPTTGLPLNKDKLSSLNTNTSSTLVEEGANRVTFNKAWFDLQSKMSDHNKKHCFKSGLNQQFLEAYQGKGESVEKRKELHQLALKNRGNLHYRWW